MNKKAVQIIVLIFIAIMFIATIIITIVIKPVNHDTPTASSQLTTSPSQLAASVSDHTGQAEGHPVNSTADS